MTATTESVLAEFFRDLARECSRLAGELDPAPADPAAGLGYLQRQIARCDGMYTPEGMTPRELMTQIGRWDEPNIRQSLDGMIRQGVTEHIPGTARPMRFRMVVTRDKVKV